MSAVCVIVYATTDEQCPAGQRFTARCFVDGKPMPVTFYAPSDPVARSAAVKWWDEQVDAERKRVAAVQRMREARKGASP